MQKRRRRTCSTTATTCARRPSSAARRTRMRPRIPASCPRTSGRCSARARGRSAGPRSRAIPEDIRVTDEAVLDEITDDAMLHRWMKLAREQIAFQGLPARICWLGYGQRHRVGLRFNELVRTGKVKAPIVIGRDHLDCGSVASPNRETEGDEGRHRRGRRLGDPQRAGQHGRRRDLGLVPPRRRRRHRLLAARRHGRRRRRHRRARRAASSAC